jgi:hypothetical protein
MAESVLLLYNIFKERKGTKGLILLKAPIPEHSFCTGQWRRQGGGKGGEANAPPNYFPPPILPSLKKIY